MHIITFIRQKIFEHLTVLDTFLRVGHQAVNKTSKNHYRRNMSKIV